jgi:hypothetical protein
VIEWGLRPPFFFFGFFTFVVVVNPMAVGAQHHTLLNFLQSLFIAPRLHQRVDTSVFHLGVYVVEIQNGWVIDPALKTGQRSFEGFPIRFPCSL